MTKAKPLILRTYILPFRFLLLAWILIIPLSCAVNPVTGKKELSLMSEEKEIAMGAQNDPSIVAQFGSYPDEQLQRFIDEKGQAMAAISHRPNLKFTFRVLDSPVVNAFALPGGYVYFTRGILAHFSNEAEFAGVLGHEIGHVTARHGAQQQTQQMLGQVGLMAGTIAGTILTQSDISPYADQAAQGLQLLFLKFGRDDESQSDRLGVEYSTKIGYDANYMAGFFGTLHRLSSQGGGETIPSFLSTHPDPLDREENVAKLAEEWQSKVPASNFKVNRDSYLRLIEGIVYGEDPNQGYHEGNVFYHPQLKFRYSFPTGWRLMNSPTVVEMIEPEGKALVQLTIGQGENAEAAVKGVIEQYKFQVQSQSSTTLNGLPAYVAEAQYSDEQNQQQLGIHLTGIGYGDLNYIFMGVTTSDLYGTYQRNFSQTGGSFQELTDPARLDVKPERVKIEEVRQTTTLQQALKGFGMPENRLEELAVLNGMQLGDTVDQGMLIKTISRN